MSRSHLALFLFFLVLSSTAAIRELEEAKTWLQCMTICLDNREIREKVDSCTLTCKNIFASQFATGRPMSRGWGGVN